MLSFSKKKKQYFEDKYKNNVLSYTVLALFNANGMVQKNKKKYQRIAVASLLVYFLV